VFLTAVALTRYISLGSVLAAIAVPLLTLLFHRSLPMVLSGCAIGALIVWRHRDNLRRLLGGTENRFGTRPPAS
jgi:glycerol-3-phosphate acyltransferase PlsY